MDKEFKNNPLFQIFKQNPSGVITEEIEDSSKFPILFDYLKDNTINLNNKIKVIDMLNEIIKIKRSICAYFPKYNNKSIYIFFFELYFIQNNSKELKLSILNLIKELSINLQITKEVYEYIFQKFALIYRKDKKLLSEIGNSPQSFNNHFYDLLNLLFSTFDNINIEKEKINPRNYFSCFGNNSFTVNFDKKNICIGNLISFIINFKISKTKLIMENPEILGKCSLIKINFNDMNKILNIELKYPFFVFIKDGKKTLNAKVCPLGEWINLIVTLSIVDGNLKLYFFVNGENSLLPLSIKNLKLQTDDIINSISFFNNFYGEVSSISMISINHNDSLNIFNKTLKYFSDYEEGIWKKKYLNNFINFLLTITYGEKKNEVSILENLCKNITFIFTPFNYSINQPNIIEDFMGSYNLVINGNIKNHRYQKYQKKIMQICSINNFLPIAEMFLIYQKKLLNEKNFLLYLKIISKIALGKKNLIFMNESNFFKLLSLFIEKFPNNILNENILNEFDNIGKIILSQNMTGFSSNYFNNILLNEKIIFKYTKELQIKFWNKILNLCMLDKEKIESFISIKKMCILLRYYDRDRYSEICCSNHLNMYKKEFIGNMKVMEPTLSDRLIHIQKILDVIILTQNPEKLVPLYRLLMLDLSPCLMKFILKLFITALDYKNKNEEWKKKLVLAIIKVKYDIIIVNAFIHNLPDIKYELLILMNSIFLVLVKLNKISEFNSLEKMIKTCLLPQKIFYMSKIGNNCANNQSEFKINENLNSKNKNVNNNKTEKQNENILSHNRISKSNSIYILASKFEPKHKSNYNETKGKLEEKELTGETSQFLKNQIESEIIQNKNNENIHTKLKSNNFQKNFIKKDSNNYNIDKNDKDKKNIEDNNNFSRFSRMTTVTKKKEDTIEYFYVKEGASIYDINKSKNETLIFKEELYDIYINSLYILFLKWALGIPLTYTPTSVSELFSSLKQQKELPQKTYFITNVNIVELIFVLNNDLNNNSFTLRCLNVFDKLIKSPENSYIILSNKKIYSSLLDIAFKYYYNNKNNDNISDLEKDIYKIGKNILVYIFINSLNFLKDQVDNPPMEQLEIIFLWGEKIILSNIDDKNRTNIVLDFIYELLLDLLGQFINEYQDKVKIEFKESRIEPRKNFYFKNYLIYMTFAYNFCFHYKVDPVIKNSDIDAFSSVSLNINIPEIFISGMRIDSKKGNDIAEYWKDFHLIEIILDKVNYVFKSDYIKNKIKKEEENIISKTEIRKKNKKKEGTIKYDKYNNILNELILNKEKKNIFKKELFLLCYYETSIKNTEIIIPVIRILSISLICILTIVKDLNNEEQLNHWLKEYKNLLKFTILSSININKNISSDTKIYTKIQNICLDVIASGLCFLNNLYECATICQDRIIKYTNSIFLLCFSILKYHYDIKNSKGIKFFGSKSQNEDLSSSAVVILFTEYIKDKNNKAPFLNANNLEKIYLNPEFKIIDLINDISFYVLFFENKNLKKQLYQKYYSLNEYKTEVDIRYDLIRTLEDKLDYSYQINIFEILPLYEKELLKYSNTSNKSKIKRKKIYIKQKKSIFSWNGMWSNRELFYEDINYHKIKYKIINHYSRNLMKPLICPILDINYYLPDFTEFDKDKLFIQKDENKDNKINNISNDLVLDFDKILKISNVNNDLSLSYNSSSNNINLNLFMSESTKNLNNFLIDEEESKNNILKQIYYQSNPKYGEFLVKLSNIIDFGKDEQLELDMIEEENQLNTINEKDGINNINDNKFKTNIRKDTGKTEITSSSTIRTENIENLNSFKSSFVNLTYDNDKNKLKNSEFLNNKEYFICCLVKPSHHIKGVIFIQEKKLIFKVLTNKKYSLLNRNKENFIEDDDYDKEKGICFGSYFTHHPKDKNLYKISIKFNDIKWILKRKYYYKNSAIEIFNIQNKSYYFNFKDEATQFIIIEEIIKKISISLMIINDIKELQILSSGKGSINVSSNTNIIGYQNNKNPLIIKKCKFIKKKKIKLSSIISQWKNWEISNFELLMLLNIFSNRSYNDISQYPVFPWLLANYSDPLKTKKLVEDENEEKNKKNLKEEDNDNIIEDYTYRDLSIPMGMLTLNEDGIKRKKNYLSTYKILKNEENVKPYIFGCNYSNPTYVCNYLIRLFPFTQICIEIQGGGFDTPRRLFSSIERAFKNATTQSTDIREIIPEFFYLPEMFININNLNMGKFDKKNLVQDATTPCRNNPYDFISTMKNVLENEYVSYNINNWIDLIFGYKAKGKEAENANNIFTEQSYQEDINLFEIKDKDSYLRYVEFGLIPNQLFNIKEFPKKEKIENLKKYKQVMNFSLSFKNYKNKKTSNNNIKQVDNLQLLTVVNISQDKLLFLYETQFNNNLIKVEKIIYSMFEKEFNEEIIEKKQINKVLDKISNIPYYHYNKNIKIINGGKVIIMSGYYDAKILVIINDVENNLFSTTEIYPFKDESLITALNVDKDEEYLFIGNALGNIRIIRFLTINEYTNINNWKMYYLINDQLNSISCIDSNNELNVWASSSIDGYINIYTLPLFKLTKSFKVPINNEVDYIFISDSPLPSIIIIGQEEVYLYSINGFKIYFQKEYSRILNPIIIKDFYGEDNLAYIIKNKEIFIRNVNDFSIKARIENETEIHYISHSEDMKILYLFNKDEHLIDVYVSDTKKSIEENQ